MFFSYVAAFELKGIGYVKDKVQNELLTQVRARTTKRTSLACSCYPLAVATYPCQVFGSWKVWPLAHAINFRFIPSSQRVLYINSIQIGYNCFLSFIANRGENQ